MPRNQKGFAPLLIVVAIAVVALIAGYFLVKSGSVTVPGVSQLIAPRATEKDFEFISDPLIRKHFVAMANTTAYRIKSTSSGRGEPISTSEIQLTGTDFKYRATETQNGKEVSQIISIGDTIYLKDYADGKWWKQVQKSATPAPGASSEPVATPTDFKQDFEKNQGFTYKSLGQEACGSLTCYKYEEVDPKNAEAKRTFWFDTGQFLLRKEISGFGEFTATNEYSYDGINISAPSPTKDVPQGHDIYEYLNQAPASGPALPTQNLTVPTAPVAPPAAQDQTAPQDQSLPPDQVPTY